MCLIGVELELISLKSVFLCLASIRYLIVSKSQIAYDFRFIRLCKACFLTILF